jgi:hypothetical protein
MSEVTIAHVRREGPIIIVLIIAIFFIVVLMLSTTIALISAMMPLRAREAHLVLHHLLLLGRGRSIRIITIFVFAFPVFNLFYFMDMFCVVLC